MSYVWGVIIIIGGASCFFIGYSYDMMALEIFGYVMGGIGAIYAMVVAYLKYRFSPRNNTIETNPIQTSMKRNKSDTDLQLIPGRECV